MEESRFEVFHEVIEVVDGETVKLKCVITYKNSILFSFNYYNEKGNLHQVSDKPAHMEFHKNGRIKHLSWYENGFPNRESSGPNYESYYDTGKLKSQYWYNDKTELHRVGGPACIKYFSDGIKVRSSIWYVNGKVNRLDGPAHTEYYFQPNRIMYEHWVRDGLYHRDEGLPAIKEYYEDGMYKSRHWYQNGKLHRPLEKGPAIINSKSYGSEEHKYYLDGELQVYENKETYIKKIREFNVEDIKKCLTFLEIINTK